MKEVLSLKHALLATLSYFDILEFPLTIEELERYLYGWSAPREAIEEELSKLENIEHSHGFYYLKGRREIAELRKECQAINAKLWKKVDKFRWLLALCPFIKMAAVCNSLAYGNAKEGSDIDLFVVTQNNRLWTSRFFMKLLTQLFGVRAHHNKIAGRFCLSFFVSEKAMDLQPLAYEFDPHLAYFVVEAAPLFGKKTYREFLTANEKWLLPYFRRPFTPKLERLRESYLLRALQWLFEKVLFFFGEAFFYRIQIVKDKERKKQLPNSEGIVMTKDVFKFHESDPRRGLAEKFRLFNN